MNEKSLRLRISDPGAIIFTLFLIGFGGYILYICANGEGRGAWFWSLLLVPFGLWMVYAGLIQVLSYIQLDAVSMTIWQPKSGLDGRGRLVPSSPILLRLRRQIFAYSDIAKASVMVHTVRAPGGWGWAAMLVLTMRDGDRRYAGLDPISRAGCRRLVGWMRERHVEVYVEPGLLGKGFK
ncbi:MAG: hypothetical protein JWN01_1019 [Patescibacteria group bacterium]|nr:hypothetical protein [Patescibacteria group bacterium]